MQVSHALESDNYAILGGGKTHNFQIASSAHAFKILSDALYQDKPMAIVRETICNIYDAHVAAGKPNEPIEISLSPTMLTFRDRGLGIADEKIEEIYLTYFGSTKTLDDSQIGGFGLGCKAPFCMTDHFMVTSHHAGMKRTYALSIGNDESNGKPTAQVMSCTPTEESGILVSVPLTNTDYSKFEKTIRRFARLSGFNVVLNGEKIDNVRDYSGIEQAGFGLYPYVAGSDTIRNQISLLYGNVIYPIDSNDETDELIRELREFITHHHQLVLYAPPSSVAIQPSREGLGYNQKTIETLNKAGQRALHQIKSVLPRIERETIIKAYQGIRRGNLYNHIYMSKGYPDLTSLKRYVGGVEVAQAIAEQKLRQTWEEDFERRVTRTMAQYYRDKRRMLLKSVNEGWSARRTNWQADQTRYRLRQLTRIVSGIKDPNLIARAGVTQSVSLAKKLHRFDEQMCHLTIAPTRTAFVGSRYIGAALISKDITQAQIAEIKKKASMFGFTVDVVEPVKVLPRSKEIREHAPKSELFTAFRFTRTIRDSRSYGEFAVPAEPSLIEPKAFHPMALAKKKVSIKPKHVEIGPMQPTMTRLRNVVRNRHAKTIDPEYFCEDVALPLSTDERDRLIAMGVPRLSEVVLKRLTDAVKPRDTRHAFTAYIAIHANEYYHYGRDSETARFAVQLTRYSRRMACAALLQPYRPSKALDETYKLWKTARAFFEKVPSDHGDWLDQSEYAVFKEHREQYEGLLKKFETYIPKEMTAFLHRLRDAKLTKNDVAHLKFAAKVFDMSSLRDLNTAEMERFIGMIEQEGKNFIAGNARAEKAKRKQSLAEAETEY